ncbi:MAG TPA: ABC transporter permease [Terriglobia bacterium]|nr:ABC transporter permease [Terriglobia bacterium]
MDAAAVIRVALRALARNKMRTVLTMLGIIIGVGAVICTVAIGEGASNQIQESLRNLGDNIVFVSAGSVNNGGVHMGSSATKTLTVADSTAIGQQVPLMVRISPGVGASAQLVYGNQNWYTRVRGVAPPYFEIRRWPVQEGGVFTQHDVDSAADVCVIGLTVVQNLFGDENPLGKTIRVQSLPFRIIGVLAPKGQSPFGQDEDDTIIIPYTTVQKKIAGISWVNFIMGSAASQEAIKPAQAQISSLLRERHHLRPDEDDDFMVSSPTDLAETQAQSGRIMTLLLASIASVSLLVGGIGIMNIMLVSVTERTREIGVRMAVGATEQDVQMQFLSEAVVLSLLGGTVGVLGGVAGSLAVSSMLDWPTRVPPEAIGIAVLFSAAVGIFFGYYPARKAARLDPIDALRYE